MELRRKLVLALVLLAIVIAFSVLGYRLIGGPNVALLQALYMTVITLAGVGYGEIVDTSHNPALRIFNMFVILFGVAITVYVFSAVTAFFVEGQLHHLFRRRKMQKKIGALRNHFIICGLGDTGRYAAQEFHRTGTPYVVIDAHEENIQRAQEPASDSQRMLYIVGDATDESVLDLAGVDRAAGLIAGVANNKDNLVITVMARQKNPSLRIVARCSDVNFAERLMRAGASSTVSPSHIGGMRLASEALRPQVVSFLDMMLRQQSKALRVEEIEIKDHSPWVGLTMDRIRLRHDYNLLPLAVKKQEVGQQFVFNPSDSMVITSGTVIIVMGDVVDVQRARKNADQQSVAASAATKVSE